MDAANVKKHLELMAVPESEYVYVLGCLDRRITIYSQQVRALNLVDALLHRGLVDTGARRLCVIGAGVAGLTAAAAASTRGVEVTVLERASDILPIFGDGQVNRWLHPRVYDWPWPGWDAREADLPVLDWEAGRVAAVLEQLRSAWEREGSDVNVVFRALDVEIHTRPDGVTVRWNRTLSTRAVFPDEADFGVVLVAVGFGDEAPELDSERRYWERDELDTNPGFRPGMDAPLRWLVSGTGDGALTDLLRLCIRDFRHDSMLEDFVSDPSVEAAAVQIRAIESDPSVGHQVHAHYLGIRALPIIEMLRTTRSRDDTFVSLNSRGPAWLSTASSPLNRFLAAQLSHAGRFRVLTGECKPTQIAEGYQVFLGQRRHVFDRVIRRHGPIPALARGFPELWTALEPLRKARAAHTVALDCTRSRDWADDAFAPTRRAPTRNHRLSTPAPASTPALETQRYRLDHRPCFIPYRAKGAAMIGRTQRLAQVQQHLHNGRTAINQAASFTGLGGVGKTQLAVEYAWAHADDYPGGVVWLTAGQGIDGQLIALCEQTRWLHPSTEHALRLAAIRQRLRSLSQALFVFDNVDRLDEIEELLPNEHQRCHVLLTSRDELPGFASVPLDLLSLEFSLELLASESGRTADVNAERVSAQRIVQLLGGLPLALELAGFYLRQRPSCRLSDYADELERKGLATRGLDQPGYERHSVTHHQASVAKTLRLSSSLLETHPVLVDVLDFFAWSALECSIAKPLLVEAVSPADVDDLREGLDLAIALGILHVEESSDTSRRYRMHRLLHQARLLERPLEAFAERANPMVERVIEWFKNCRATEDLETFEAQLDHLEVWQQNAELLADNDGLIRLQWLRTYPLWHRGHLESAAEGLTLALAREPADPSLRAAILADRGEVAWGLTRYLDALAFQLQALCLRLECFGEDHLDTASSYSTLADALAALSTIECAIECESRALAIRTRHLGPVHAETLICHSSLSSLHLLYGQVDQAEVHAGTVLDTCLEIHGERRAETAFAYLGVANVHVRRGEYERALEFRRRALAIQRQVIGDDNPLTAATLLAIGMAGQNEGELALEFAYESIAAFTERQDRGMDPEESRRSIKQAIVIYERLTGPYHPILAQGLDCLGRIEYSLGNHEAALELHRRALDIRQRSLGAGNSLTMSSHISIGLCLATSGDFQGALELLTPILEGLELGDSPQRSAHLTSTLSHRGYALAMLGRHAEALHDFERSIELVRLQREPSLVIPIYYNAAKYLFVRGQHDRALEYRLIVLEFARSKLGQRSSTTQAAYLSVSESFGALGRHDEALAAATEALAIVHELYGENDLASAACHDALAKRHANLGQHDAAGRQFELGHAIRQQKLGDDHIDTIRSLNAAAKSRYSQRQYAEALELHTRARDHALRALGRSNPLTATLMSSVGDALFELGRPKEALVHQREGLELRQALGIDDDSATATLHSNLGNSYRAAGQLDAAQPHYERALEMRMRIFGEDHLQTAKTHHKLGRLHSQKHERDAALHHHSRGLAIRRAQLGEDHLDTALSYILVGVVHYNRKDFAYALPALHRALEIRRARLGDTNTTTAEAFQNLGDTHFHSGNYETALEHYSHALASHRKVLGDAHFRTAKSFLKVVRTLWMLNRRKAARRSCMEALEVVPPTLAEHAELMKLRGTWHAPNPHLGVSRGHGNTKPKRRKPKR